MRSARARDALIVVPTLLPLTLMPFGGVHAAGPNGKAYVVLFKDNAVAVLDTGANTVLATIPVPTGPHGIVATPDGKKVYVSSDGASTVSAIDTASEQVVGNIEVGKEPRGVAVTPDGKLLIVGGRGAGSVVFVDTATDQVASQVAVASARNIAVSPDGKTAYVGSQAQGAPTLAILDVGSKSQVGSVPIEKNPRGLSFSPDGRWMYFTMAGLDAVVVLDPTRNEIVHQVSMGPSPHFPLFTSGGLGLSDSQGLNHLAVIDPTSHAVKATIVCDLEGRWS